jgi:hypothetical protein
VPRLIDGMDERNGGAPMKRTPLSVRRARKAILFVMMASGVVGTYFLLAPVPGGTTPIDASLPGVTETATFALG